MHTRVPAILQLLAFAVCIALTLTISIAHASDSSKMNQKLIVRPGDLITQKDKDGWHAIKILAVDPWPDGTSAAHCLTYNPLPNKPSVASLKQAGVRVWHAPIDAGSFKEGWELLGNQSSSKDEMVGFVEYLRLTDFPRYVRFTGQDPKEIVRRANEHYKRASSLGDQGKRTEAIAEYSKAIDLFPPFYEAIDNRAFTYMELGKFREALSDFEFSLRVNPNGMAAFFSRGECLMKLGDLAPAEAIFLEGKTRFPEQHATFEKFLNHVRALRK
jgi:tetratricopeptide (TPR) repeat protein